MGNNIFLKKYTNRSFVFTSKLQYTISHSIYQKVAKIFLHDLCWEGQKASYFCEIVLCLTFSDLANTSIVHRASSKAGESITKQNVEFPMTNEVIFKPRGQG